MNNRLRLEFAARVFLGDMRRHFTAAHPDREMPPMNFETYPVEHRKALMDALERSAKALTDESYDLDYADWLEEKLRASQEGK